ncbi:MAG: ribosome maturation factor RimM [Eubacterium sp.]
MKSDLLRVGVISNTHGIKGEIKVFPTTDDPKRFNDLKSIILDTGREHINFEICSVKYFKQFVILKFNGIDNINEIEKYKGCDLLVTRDNAVELAPNEYFIADLIGLKVITDYNEDFGTIKDVIQTGANDVYEVVTTSGQEVLLPVIDECILDVNIEDGFVKAHIMKGLLD